MEGTMPPEAPVMGGMPAKPEKTSALAIVALVLSVIGVCCLIPAVVGMALGFVELNRIKSGDSSAKGQTVAKMAVIVGIVAIALNILSTIYLIYSGGFNFEFSTQS